MARSRYIVGIDLGTTNCAVAYVDRDTKGRGAAQPRKSSSFPCRSLSRRERRSREPCCRRSSTFPVLTSCPRGRRDSPGVTDPIGSSENSPGRRGRRSRRTWSRAPRAGSVIPASTGRQTSSRGEAPAARRASPVEASGGPPDPYSRLLEFPVRHGTRPALRLELQEVVLTVPASFDEAARELTVEAAKRAGLANLTLLEEPQAAFYCWIVSHQDGWQREVRAGELILVCDIGGGTTDFSLITVMETPTGPGFRRVAVGDHLMLGGDNMDLALAHKVEAKLGGARLDTEQWSALRYACRTAKEKLLGDDPPDRWPVTIAGRGSRIIGGSLQSELTRAEISDVVLEGFFPGSPQRMIRLEEPSSACRSSACRSCPTRPSPNTWVPFCAGTRPRRSSPRVSRRTIDPPGPMRSCSTAERSPRQSSSIGWLRSLPAGSRRILARLRSLPGSSRTPRSTSLYPSVRRITGSSGEVVGSGSEVARPDRITWDSSRRRSIDPGYAWSRAMLRKGKPSRSSTAISTS